MQVGLSEEDARKFLRYERNFFAVQDTKPGSDLYGVLEKTAFHIGLLTGNPDNIQNWLNARIELADYTSQSTPYLYCSPLNCLDLSVAQGKEDCFGISGRLKIMAEEKSRLYKEFSRFHHIDKKPSDFDFWMHAQDDLARAVADSFYRKQKLAEERIRRLDAA